MLNPNALLEGQCLRVRLNRAFSCLFLRSSSVFVSFYCLCVPSFIYHCPAYFILIQGYVPLSVSSPVVSTLLVNIVHFALVSPSCRYVLCSCPFRLQLSRPLLFLACLMPYAFVSPSCRDFIPGRCVTSTNALLAADLSLPQQHA